MASNSFYVKTAGTFVPVRALPTSEEECKKHCWCKRAQCCTAPGCTNVLAVCCRCGATLPIHDPLEEATPV